MNTLLKRKEFSGKVNTSCYIPALADQKDKKFFSDESQALTHYGFDVDFVAGDRENFKISFPEDINLISPFDSFVGRGIDFHKYEYCAGSQITLAGVKIKSDYKIIAHSDGDIIFHALADSLLGAGGFRDIGFYFPDIDKSNFQLDSSKIVSKSLDLAFLSISEELI